MSRFIKKYINFVLFFVILDQLTKYIVTAKIGFGQVVEITSFFQLTHTGNTGVAFGMFNGANTFFMFLTVVIIIFFSWWYNRYFTNSGLVSDAAFVLILSGAFGNLLDRVLRGHVVDFLEFHITKHYWPAFNVADSCITVGGVLIFWLILFTKETAQQQDK